MKARIENLESQFQEAFKEEELIKDYLKYTIPHLSKHQEVKYIEQQLKEPLEKESQALYNANHDFSFRAELFKDFEKKFNEYSESIASNPPRLSSGKKLLATRKDSLVKLNKELENPIKEANIALEKFYNFIDPIKKTLNSLALSSPLPDNFVRRKSSVSIQPEKKLSTINLQGRMEVTPSNINIQNLDNIAAIQEQPKVVEPGKHFKVIRINTSISAGQFDTLAASEKRGSLTNSAKEEQKARLQRVLTTLESIQAENLRAREETQVKNLRSPNGSKLKG